MKKLLLLAVGIALATTAFAATNHTSVVALKAKKATTITANNQGNIAFKPAGFTGALNTEAQINPATGRTNNYQLNTLNGNVSYGFANRFTVVGSFALQNNFNVKNKTTPAQSYVNDNVGIGLEYTAPAGYQFGLDSTGYYYNTNNNIGTSGLAKATQFEVYGQRTWGKNSVNLNVSAFKVNPVAPLTIKGNAAKYDINASYTYQYTTQLNVGFSAQDQIATTADRTMPTNLHNGGNTSQYQVKPFYLTYNVASFKGLTLSLTPQITWQSVREAGKYNVQLQETPEAEYTYTINSAFNVYTYTKLNMVYQTKTKAAYNGTIAAGMNYSF